MFGFLIYIITFAHRYKSIHNFNSKNLLLKNPKDTDNQYALLYSSVSRSGQQTTCEIGCRSEDTEKIGRIAELQTESAEDQSCRLSAHNRLILLSPSIEAIAENGQDTASPHTTRSLVHFLYF